jgi:hypothetical protein
VDGGIAAWITSIKQTPAGGMEAKKGEILQMRDAVQYLMHFKFLPDNFLAKPEIEKIIKDNGWEEKK